MAGALLLIYFSAHSPFIHGYYTEPQKEPIREIIARITELDRQSNGDILFVSIDPAYVVEITYPYYIKQFGFTGQIETVPMLPTPPYLFYFLTKAKEEGKNRMVMFNVRFPQEEHPPLVEEADTQLDIIDVTMQLTPMGGDITTYDLTPFVTEETLPKEMQVLNIFAGPHDFGSLETLLLQSQSGNNTPRIYSIYILGLGGGAYRHTVHRCIILDFIVPSVFYQEELYRAPT